jgi:hypothetical protein
MSFLLHFWESLDKPYRSLEDVPPSTGYMYWMHTAYGYGGNAMKARNALQAV